MSTSNTLSSHVRMFQFSRLPLRFLYIGLAPPLRVHCAHLCTIVTTCSSVLMGVNLQYAPLGPQDVVIVGRYSPAVYTMPSSHNHNCRHDLGVDAFALVNSANRPSRTFVSSAHNISSSSTC
jgi:hypothetical protein